MPAIEYRITPAIEQALKFSPINPMGMREIDKVACDKIYQWSNLQPDSKSAVDEPSFIETYAPLAATIEQRFGKDGVDAFNRFLVFQASVMASRMIPNAIGTKGTMPDYDQVAHDKATFEGWRYIAANQLLLQMTHDDIDITEVWNRTWNDVRKMDEEAAIMVGRNLEAIFPTKPAIASAFGLIAGETPSLDDADYRKFDTIASGLVAKYRQLHEERPDLSLLRLMRGAAEEMKKRCREAGIKNWWLDLSLGDRNGGYMPPPLQEALGYNRFGPRGHSIGESANAYLGLMYEAYENPFGYDGSALGWEGVRQIFTDWAAYLGLTSEEKPIVGSLLGNGSSDVLPKIYLAAKEYFQEKNNKPTVFLFPNPAYLAVAQFGRNVGLEVIDFVTKKDDRFIPTEETIQPLIEKYKDTHNIVYIDTPVLNPPAVMRPIGDVATLDAYLAEHDVLKIVDGAYFDVNTQPLCEQLREYKGPIIFVLSSSKTAQLGARPGLRLGWAGTPTKEIADRFVSVAQRFNLGMSYATETEFLGIQAVVGEAEALQDTDFVSSAQSRVAAIIQDANERRVEAGLPPILGKGPILFEKGIYISWPKPPDVDPFDYVYITGLVTSPYEAHIHNGGPKVDYVRATVTNAMIPQLEDLLTQ